MLNSPQLRREYAHYRRENKVNAMALVVLMAAVIGCAALIAAGTHLICTFIVSFK